MAKFNEEKFLNSFAKLMASTMVVAKGDSDAIATVAEALASNLGKARFIAGLPSQSRMIMLNPARCTI